MSSGALQLSRCSRGGGIDQITTSFWGLGISGWFGKRVSGVNRRGYVRVYAVSSDSNGSLKMNLNEYMVTLDKPLGIRFALSADGKIFVHALKKGVCPLSLSLSLSLW
ncbi:hypothetical protein RJ641_022706 [Dillenia turbinata]|uniref:Uncharacterized protein n=1 Tax=Dillenia turbinata TaxID=194707 RepID=A0AAN8UCY4_9MAGN